jgi:acyl-CoA synthetase (AMP-forming)/AMP-acid ligase II
VGECVAFGVPHPALGHSICVIATGKDGAPLDSATLLTECKQRMPAYMVPSVIEVRDGPLPRNPNGKIDRKTLSTEFENQHKVQQ